MSSVFGFPSFGSFRRNKTTDKDAEKTLEGGASVPVVNEQNVPSQDQTTATSMHGEVDGLKGWSVVLGAFLAHLTVLGLLYAFGIFVLPISSEFQVSRADASLVGTINIAFFYVGGIFAGPLADRFGVRPVVSVGSLVWVIGCMLASITNALWQQHLTQGVLIGLGTSLVYWPAISVVPQWFDKYRGTAVGFAALGAGIGNMIFALAGQSIINALGWRNTLRVLGGVGAVLLCIVILLVERRVPPRRTGGLFDVAKTLVKLKSYRWFLLTTFLFQWGFFVPFVHIAAYARDLGIDSTLQSLAVAMLGIGSSVGRVAIGPVADKFGRMNTFRVCMFLAGVSMAIWPACQNISSILAFAFFYAFFAGGFIAQSPVVAGDLWGVNNLGGTFALLNLVMVPGGLACGPIAGLVYEQYGSYWGAIWGAAVFLLLAASCLLMVRKEATVTTAMASPVISALPAEPVNNLENPALEQKDTDAKSRDDPSEVASDNPVYEKA